MQLGPVTIHRPQVWYVMWRSKQRCGIFRNLPHVRPGRWGFFFLGFEFGSRNPGNKFGLFLRAIGVWPW